MEELFTNGEIKEILKEAENPKYRQQYSIHLTFSKLQIFKVSTKGLIFVHGNQHTGMEHIQFRHSNTSRKLFKKNDGSLDNPTKFTLAPVEYATVCDAIYQPENLSTEKNRRPELFDCYKGDYTHRNGKTFEYTLILYKGTKIVHTLFLSNNKKPFNKKVKLPIRQGWAGGTHNYSTGLQEFAIDYLDDQNVIRFKVILRCDLIVRLEKWYLQVNDIFGVPLFTHYIKEEKMVHMINTPSRIGQLDFQDLTWIDKKLLSIISGKYEFEPDLIFRYNQEGVS